MQQSRRIAPDEGRRVEEGGTGKGGRVERNGSGSAGGRPRPAPHDPRPERSGKSTDRLNVENTDGPHLRGSWRVRAAGAEQRIGQATRITNRVPILRKTSRSYAVGFEASSRSPYAGGVSPGPQ